MRLKRRRGRTSTGRLSVLIREVPKLSTSARRAGGRTQLHVIGLAAGLRPQFNTFNHETLVLVDF
jgi:hypothetical protein